MEKHHLLATQVDLIYHDDLRNEQRDLEKQFADIASKKDLSVATDFNDLNCQLFLKRKLDEYPISGESDGYINWQFITSKGFVPKCN